MARKPLVGICQVYITFIQDVGRLQGEEHWKNIAHCIDVGGHFERRRNLACFEDNFKTALNRFFKT